MLFNISTCVLWYSLPLFMEARLVIAFLTLSLYLREFAHFGNGNVQDQIMYNFEKHFSTCFVDKSLELIERLHVLLAKNIYFRVIKFSRAVERICLISHGSRASFVNPHFPHLDWISRVSRIKRFISPGLIYSFARATVGQKLGSCLRHRSNNKPSSPRFQAVDTRRHTVLEEAQKTVPLVQQSWAKTKTETKSVTFAPPAHANHRLNYSLTTYPPTTFLQKAALLKTCTFISTVPGRGSISLSPLGQRKRRNFIAQPFVLSISFLSSFRIMGHRMLIREWWNYPRVWLPTVAPLFLGRRCLKIASVFPSPAIPLMADLFVWHCSPIVGAVCLLEVGYFGFGREIKFTGIQRCRR